MSASVQPPPGPAFAGVWFDGRTAAARRVAVRIEGRTLSVDDADGTTLAATTVDRARVSERWEATPRLVALRDGASLEVDDPDGGFDAALQRAGVEPGIAVAIQRQWWSALMTLTGLVGLLAWGYLYGLPVLAHWAAERFPMASEREIGATVLAHLDQRVFAASELPAARREAIDRRVHEVAGRVAPDIEFRLEFRRIDGPRGINALTLPGGTIVLLDGLVDLADEDGALLGVVGHELGHVRGRHSLRQLLQTLGVGAAAGMVWGDFSTVLANVPLAFGALRYSRALEREADEFAIGFLQSAGIDLAPYIAFHDKVDALAAKRRRFAPAFLSTHPAAGERQERLRAAAAAQRP